MIISDDTKIALVVYTAKIENNEVVPTSDPTMIRFCTNVLDIQPVDFSITVEPTSTKVNIKADARKNSATAHSVWLCSRRAMWLPAALTVLHTPKPHNLNSWYINMERPGKK